MTAHDRARLLAMRRQSLVLRCRVQRLDLARDLRAVSVRADPLALASRWAQARPGRTLVALLAVGAVMAWRHWAMPALARRALPAWRRWLGPASSSD